MSHPTHAPQVFGRAIGARRYVLTRHPVCGIGAAQ